MIETPLKASKEQMQVIYHLGNCQDKLHSKRHNNLGCDFKKMDMCVSGIRQDLARLQSNVNITVTAE